MSDITIPLSSKSAINSINRTNEQLFDSIENLTSGNRLVNPFDDIKDYYFNQSISNRAQTFLETKDQINKGIGAINAGREGLSTAKDFVEQAEGLLEQAKSTSDKEVRESLAKDFNETIKQIDSVTEDSSFNGTNLIKENANDFTVDFNPFNNDRFRVEGKPSNKSNLGLTEANDFSTNDEIQNKFEQVRDAKSNIESNQSSFENDLNILETRSQFNDNYSNTLLDSVTRNRSVDFIDETAKLLSAQTRNQIANQTLSLINETNRNAVLNLFD